MADDIYPKLTREVAETRAQLTPGAEATFRAFSHEVYSAGALSAKMKQIIAVAAAHITQCPYCIDIHTRQALRQGASPEEIMEAIWVAAEIRAGGAVVHTALAVQQIDAAKARDSLKG